MLATFTLATTTFANNVSEQDTQVNLTSTTGVIPGITLFAGREAMRVEFLTGIGNYAKVRRGSHGTATRSHSAGYETVYLAQGYQLFEVDPQGYAAPSAPLSNPHINVLNGTVWVVVGDDDGSNIGERQWQQVTTTLAAGGPLGIRTNTVVTPS